VSQKAAKLPLPKWCCARLGNAEPEKIQKIAGKIRQNRFRRFFKDEREGQPLAGAARSKAGEASLNDASVCSNRR
jgi:hypothetical protein